MVSKIVDLSSKVVVVTGASMGIGEAIAKIFADRGSRVVLLSRDAGRAEAARGRIGHTDRTLALSCDVRNREEIDRVLSGSIMQVTGCRIRSLTWIWPHAAICSTLIFSEPCLACRP